MKTELPAKEKPVKQPKKDKPATSKITITLDGDYMVIRIPRKVAIAQLLNS